MLTKGAFSLQADGDEPQVFKFAQTFHLVQEAGSGSFYVSHDIFKLIF